ncbi:hypothetical protein [Staphylothermus hellenicus]|uniref:Uncharacterized protein n=1 Tax=Staphylothermus hellenicus (strain DSM 12710 / JCM 10830 / BK20S6-10-b1 / P8) TaxID=591019 RepID=D7DBA3_STAHD|nr:hypothetical protein [Staphylothermus hellenicus]ADI31450.1 hypothetical protein Shell_0317 [Staphylothermus hellenicus DSM 12710]
MLINNADHRTSIFKNLISVIMIFMLIIMNSPIISFALYWNMEDVITLHIKLSLLDNKPLPNAEIIVKPTIYSTHEYTGKTNNDGVATITTEYNAITKTVYIKVYYWIYGEIYSGKINVDNENITITLNYTIFKTSINIYNEYLEPASITYKLLYVFGNNQTMLLENNTATTQILINGVIDNHYLLLNNNTLQNYVLQLNTMEKHSITIRFNQEIIEEKKIIVDTHNPIVSVERSTYSIRKINHEYFYKILLTINICDGVNTEDTRLYVKYYYPKEKEQEPFKIYLAGFKTNGSTTISIYNVSSSGIINETNKTLILNITAVDPSGKSTTLFKTIYLSILTKPNHTSTTTTTTTITTKYSIGKNTSTASNTLFSTNTSNLSTSYFNPPHSGGGEAEALAYIYYLGPIISATLLLYEFIRLRLGE